MQLFLGDCLDLMRDIPDESVDMICTDLPYGTTACKWDTQIQLDKLWEQYERLIKDDGAIVLTATQPFASQLILSKPKLFKYEWIWQKQQGTNPLLAKKQPMRCHEHVLIFGKKPRYYPQMGLGTPYAGYKSETKTIGEAYGNRNSQHKQNFGSRYPLSVIKFNTERTRGGHPTQKPVALIEYLLKTYTCPGDIVLDSCMGSGTTGVACKNTGRDFIGIELDEKWFNVAKNRLKDKE